MISRARDCKKIAVSANMVIRMFQKKDRNEEKLNPVEFECFYEDTSKEQSNVMVAIDADQMEGLIY